MGYGARIGLLRETGPLPAVSVSVMRRDMPQITYGNVSGGDRYSYAVDLHATNLRLVASKQLMILDLAAGLGWDKYTGDAVIRFRDPITGSHPARRAGRAQQLARARVSQCRDEPVGSAADRRSGIPGWQGSELCPPISRISIPRKGKLFAGLGLRVGF